MYSDYPVTVESACRVDDPRKAHLRLPRSARCQKPSQWRASQSSCSVRGPRLGHSWPCGTAGSGECGTHPGYERFEDDLLGALSAVTRWSEALEIGAF